MKRLKNVHPGEVLKEEFLTPLGIWVYRIQDCQRDRVVPDSPQADHKG